MKIGRRGHLPSLIVALPCLIVMTGCAEGEASTIERELERDHEAAYYVDRLREMGYEVSLAQTGDGRIELLAEGEAAAYRVGLSNEGPGTPVTAVEVEDAGDETEVETRPVDVTLPARSRIDVTLDGRLSSADARVGQSFTLTVREDVMADGEVAIPAGSTVWGRVEGVEPAERPQSGGSLHLVPTEVEVRGRRVALDGTVTAQGAALEGSGSAREDWKSIAAGAGVGGLVGGVLEGGTGALAGIAIGGGGTFLATKGEEVVLTQGTPLTVELETSRAVPLIE
ncbi:MAG: hypothetical protein RQ745_10120 [Longimicrobiales bacterium]|nr:hypothetical protein [Longimicrobiales bacterium]